MAELGSVMIGMAHGVQVEPREDNAAYVQSWCQRLTERPRAIFEAASLAGRAADFLNAPLSHDASPAAPATDSPAQAA